MALPLNVFESKFVLSWSLSDNCMPISQGPSSHAKNKRSEVVTLLTYRSNAWDSQGNSDSSTLRMSVMKNRIISTKLLAEIAIVTYISSCFEIGRK